MTSRTHKRTIICDIDGTIADLSHRLHHINPPPGQRKNWVAFHDGVGGDAPHSDMLTILWLLTQWKLGWHSRRVVYVSGRMSRTRDDTRQWLDKHGFPPGDLHMRDDGDFRSDDVVKEEILDTQLCLTPDDVLCVLDDRDRVVSMWRRRGFRCMQVAPGDF